MKLFKNKHFGEKRKENSDFSYPTKALNTAYKILKDSGSVLVLEMAATIHFVNRPRMNLQL
mgnify:CR=1 FL=1